MGIYIRGATYLLGQVRRTCINYFLAWFKIQYVSFTIL